MKNNFKRVAIAKKQRSIKTAKTNQKKQVMKTKSSVAKRRREKAVGTSKRIGSRFIRIQKIEYDKFYTKPEISALCIQKLFETIGDNECTFLDPAVGNGSFYKNLPEPKIGMDIAPECDGVKKQDFLTWKPTSSDRIITVTNPPFGRNNNMAIQFINHAAVFSKYIAMILPDSFYKQSLYDSIDLHLYKIKTFKLNKKSFLVNGKPYHVPCSFFIFEKREKPRKKKPFKGCKYFHFLKPSQKMKADVEIYRVMNRAGTCAKGIIGIEGNYFVKVNKKFISKSKFIKVFNSGKQPRCIYHCVGMPSISRQEVVDTFMKKLKKASRRVELSA